MKIIQETKTCNRTYTVDRYEAEDGTIFDDAKECLKYDFQCYKEKMEPPISAGYIQSLYEDCSSVELVYLKTTEDFNYIMLRDMGVGCGIETDFFDCREGWYLYWSESGGDHPDSFYIKNYERYLKKARQDLDGWAVRAAYAILTAKR